MTAFYNEIDPFAAAWLRNLIDAGHIAPGVVDERDIRDIRPDELAGYDQCHFFAGIGGWSLALRLADWPDDRPVWTGSCPCQPFSGAGKGGGFADERHLWPAFHWLIAQCRPERILGEQVASKDGLAWLDLVQADLEGAGYAVGAIDACAAGIGAPHIRQRLWWVANASEQGLPVRSLADDGRGALRDEGPTTATGFLSRGLADPDSTGSQPGQRDDQAARHGDTVAAESSDGGMAYTAEPGRSEQPVGDDRADGRPAEEPGRLCTPGIRTGPTNGFWRDADWLLCRDGKWRPVEPGTFPLAHGAPARVGRLRAYGNAIVAPQAAAFIEAVLDVEAEQHLRLSGVFA